ncbi:uncharacterized protein A4U43_C03F13590 [Asparagus officinalis]|uniref:SKP1 component dimerisation domain-containing protein n=1 Tax=Asparagus officinalis TaxID=4686 RepID=A0A5P1FAC9_ASPOF|nr:SKP1-like protein 1B [Asparagus officinalis]ONK75122.1 uncharacterized protein A4U43_C03F13590 [Asparagus officinalis]
MESKRGEEEEMTITLKCLPGGVEVVLSPENAEAVAKESLKIWEMINSGEKEAGFRVGEGVLRKAMEYCYEHGRRKRYTLVDFMYGGQYYPPHKHPAEYEENKAVDEGLRDWDNDFIRGCDTETVLELITAADHLMIIRLSDLVCQSIVDMTIGDAMIGEGADMIQKIFKVKFDMTQNELEEEDNENRLMLLNKSVLKESNVDSLLELSDFIASPPTDEHSD